MSQKRFTRHRPLFSSPVPKRNPKIKWAVLPILWMAIKRTCFVIGFFVLFSVFMAVIASMSVRKQALPDIPEEAVLYLEFKDEIRELPQRASFSDPFVQGKPTVRSIVKAIDKAAVDNRIKGIAARMYDGNFSLAHIQEIRGALKRFRETGKFTKIYSSSYGSAGSGIARYYLASVFEERWMQPMGIVAIAGVRAEVPFLRNVLDKIGVEPQFYQKKEYKTAYESVTRKTISPENKRMLGDIIDGIKNVMLADIPPDLDMDAAEFNTLVDEGVFTAGTAVVEGLITHNDYADVMVSEIKEAVTGDPDYDETLFVSVGGYLRALHDKPKGPKVALVYVVGAIMSSNGDDFVRDGVASSDVIAPAIQMAAEDEDIEVIVLRVNSPGGSPAASESILRAVQKAQERGKIVVVSMGSMAASGGYWVAASADRIFALETTLTGSIGVVGGKVATEELWKKIGVNWDDSVSWGKKSGMWSFNTPFNRGEAGKMNEMLDHVYDSFITRVAAGRGMEKVEVDRIARGRVWTGAQALEIGLVDQIGGLYDALGYVAGLLDVEFQDDLEIVVMPRRKSFQEQLVELVANSGSVYEGLRLQAALGRFMKPAIEAVSVLGGGDPVLAYEPLRVE